MTLSLFGMTEVEFSTLFCSPEIIALFVLLWFPEEYNFNNDGLGVSVASQMSLIHLCILTVPLPSICKFKR